MDNPYNPFTRIETHLNAFRAGTGTTRARLTSTGARVPLSAKLEVIFVYTHSERQECEDLFNAHPNHFFVRRH